MERIFERNLLFDFYGELLTEHQRDIYRDAVYEDLSLSELSIQYGITRQGIHDLIKRCDKILNEYEEKLQLIDKFMKIKGMASEIQETLNDVSESEARDKIEKLTENIINKL